MTETFYVVVNQCGEYLGYAGYYWVSSIEEAKQYSTISTAKRMFTCNMNEYKKFLKSPQDTWYRARPDQQPDHIEEWVKVSSKVKDI